MTDDEWATVVVRVAEAYLAAASLRRGRTEPQAREDRMRMALAGFRELVEAAEYVIESRWHTDPDVVALSAALKKVRGEGQADG